MPVPSLCYCLCYCLDMPVPSLCCTCLPVPACYQDCNISLLATDWYLGLFSTSLPSETVARVWDALFSEGPKILFR